MLAKRIIPCLDVKGGRVVKGVGFVNLKDAGDPVEIAKLYEAQGADELCFLDITASSDEREILLDIVRRTAEEVSMPLTVGGGVRTLEDVRTLLAAGADKVSINTAAVQNPAFVREAALQFGSSTIVVAIDAKRRDENGWEVFTHGGRKATGVDAATRHAVNVSAASQIVGDDRRRPGAILIPALPAETLSTQEHRLFPSGVQGETPSEQ